MSDYSAETLVALDSVTARGTDRRGVLTMTMVIAIG